MSWDPSQLDSPPPAEMPPPPPPVQRPQHPLRRLFAPFAGAALLVWKLLGPLLIAVKNVKLLGDLLSRDTHAGFVASLADDPDLATT